MCTPGLVRFRLRPEPQSYFLRAGRLAVFVPADFFLVDRLAVFFVDFFVAVFFVAVFFFVDFLAVDRLVVARLVTFFLGDRFAVVFFAAFFVAISVAPYWASSFCMLLCRRPAEEKPFTPSTC